jgi:hypothetical protein
VLGVGDRIGVFHGLCSGLGLESRMRAFADVFFFFFFLLLSFTSSQQQPFPPPELALAAALGKREP